MSTGTDLLAAAFSQARPRLVRVAYAIIGSHSEAEDIVGDCWFRLAAADQDELVRDVEAWAVVACHGWRLTCCGPPGSGGNAMSARGCPSRWSPHLARRPRIRRRPGDA